MNKLGKWIAVSIASIVIGIVSCVTKETYMLFIIPVMAIIALIDNS